ncbi:MAG: CdaR family protein [Thermoanaerobaculaceae bacterium]
MRFLPRSPGNMVLAVVLACLVWYASALDRRERISERQLDTPVTLVNVPAETVITSEVPRFLSLRVRGPLSRLRSLDQAQTGVVIDLRGVGEGDHEFAVETRNVIVPGGVEVLAVAPSQVPLRLERMGRRRVPVKPNVSGEPAAGMVVGIVATEPQTVVVSGPRLQLERLQAVPTDPVSIDGADSPVDTFVAVRSPRPLMRIVEPLAVRVIVEITPGRSDSRGGRRR